MKKSEEKIIAYKGFDKDLKCRDFQYEVGKTYTIEDENIKVCERGFHASPNPSDVFFYYSPNDSRYCEVELSGMIDDSEDKLCASTIKIVRELTLVELANAPKKYVEEHIEKTENNTGNRSSASNTGDRSSASNTGDRSSASNTGDRSSAQVAGIDSCAAVFGCKSKVKGALGCALFLTERDEKYKIVNVLAVIVDGEKVKADTWYELQDGELIEVE